MSTDGCAAGVTLEALIDEWFDARGASTLEEHWLGCDACTARLAWIASVGDHVAAIVRGGELPIVMTVEMLERLRRQHLRIREYEVAPGASVNCTIAPDDDVVVAHLRTALGQVSRIDLVISSGDVTHRLEDVPFDRDSAEIIVAPSTRILRTLEHATETIRLVGRDAAGAETELGDYTFRHAPYGSVGT